MDINKIVTINISSYEIPDPLSYYSKSKIAPEEIVKTTVIDWSIARIVLGYRIIDNMPRSNIVLYQIIH